MAQGFKAVPQTIKADTTKNKVERITVSTIKALLFVDAQDIMYCESKGNYTRLYKTNGEIILVSKTLKRIEESLLNNGRFCRIHNSYLINLNYIQRYINTNGGKIILKNGKVLLVSRRRKALFFDVVQRL